MYYYVAKRPAIYKAVTQDRFFAERRLENLSHARRFGISVPVALWTGHGPLLSDHGMNTLKILTDLTIVLFMFGGFVYCLLRLLIW